MTTAIRTEAEIAVTAELVRVSVFDALLTVCALVGKNPGDYNHLDQGRQKMCAGNLARGAMKKDPAFAGRLLVELAKLETKAAYKRPSRSKSAKAARGLIPAAAKAIGDAVVEIPAKPALDWPASKRFQFAALVDGAWKYSYTRKNDSDTERN